jgi:hypothetical protein
MRLPDTLVYGGRKPGQRTASEHFHFLMINFPFNLKLTKAQNDPDPRHFGTDPDPWIRTTDLWIRIRLRILLFSSATFKISTTTNFCLLLFEVTFTLFFKNKSHKEGAKQYRRN